MLQTGMYLFISLVILLLLGVPIAMSLGISALFSVVATPGLTVSSVTIAQRIYGGMDSSSIMAIAFFVLAGNLMTKGGISKKICEFSNSLVGNMRGGMAIVLVISCAFFASISGSAPATVLAIGAMLYDDMIEQGYPEGRTAGLLTVAGGMGPIIPPSIIMVIYATLTGASVGDMFKSGLFIGVIIAVVLGVIAFYYAKKENWPKDNKKMSLKLIFTSFLKGLPALMLPIIILGGIYSGKLTPTEASAVAVVWAAIAGLFIYKELTFKDLPQVFLDSAKNSAMILFITATSTAFSWVFTYSGVSKALVAQIVSMNLNPLVFNIVVAVVLLLFGTFMEGIATATLLVPILWPIANAMGINVIHFGMIFCVSNVIGTMTPPVAVNIFSARSVSGLDVGEIAKGEMPFFIGYVCVFFLVVLFPIVSTFAL